MNILVRRILRIKQFCRIVPFLFCVGAAAAQWTINIVDGGHGGKHTALAFDAGGNGHAIYVDETNRELRYAFWDHRLNKWFSMRVDAPCNGYSSMVLDSQGRPHVSYIEYGTGKLKYAMWDGARWTNQVIHVTSRLIEYYTSIALDLNDRPIIAYYEVLDAESPEYSLRLRSVHWTGSLWEMHTVDSAQGSGKFNSIATSPDGHLSIGYANVKDENASLRYAYWNGTAWKPEILAGQHQAYYCRSVAMIVDSSNTPHMTYADVAAHQIRYATRRNGQWTFEVVAPVVREGYPDRNGIALDEAGNPYISFYDAGAGMLKVAHRLGKQWLTEVVDNDFAGFTSSIRISHGEVFVIYYDSMNNSLRCARRPLQPVESAASGEAQPQ